VKKNNQLKGTLYICGTPIGNLEDITLRALNVLKKVDLIAAEDTRHTKKLLSHYQINTPVTSYYEYNKFKKAPYLIEKIRNGQKIALVSDAGMPGISDPGYFIVNLALKNDIKVIPIPGVSAVITALVVSGLPSEHFIFEGFLPRKCTERKKYFGKIESENRTLIFYETPHRLKKTLRDMLKIWGDRRIVIARELTKKYEEVLRGEISEILKVLEDREIKGEITLIVEGNTRGEKYDESDLMKRDKIIEEFLKELILQKYSNKEIIKIAQEKLNISKNIIYKRLLEIKDSG